MHTRYTVALAMVAGMGVGAVAVEGLHAQGKPVVYTVNEIQITDMDAYTKEYAPLGQAGIRNAGGKRLASGPAIALSGATVAPSTRLTIQAWDSMEKAIAYRSSTEFKKSREVGEKYAKFRSLAVEGLPQ